MKFSGQVELMPVKTENFPPHTLYGLPQNIKLSKKRVIPSQSTNFLIKNKNSKKSAYAGSKILRNLVKS
jgi:hypothetical protein